MKKQFTCIVCPNGCEIEAEVENGQVISVTGHTCPRGEQYVRQELTAPRRTIASSVLVKGGELPVTSVRLTKAVPKDMIFPVMDEIRKVVLTAPVKAGTIQIVVRVCILGDKDLLRTVGADLFQHLRQNGFGLFCAKRAGDKVVLHIHYDQKFHTEYLPNRCVKTHFLSV